MRFITDNQDDSKKSNYETLFIHSDFNPYGDDIMF